MPRQARHAAIALIAALATTCASAWGPDGHHTVGALADRLVAGTHAQARVRKLLGGLTLEQAAVWADCAKGVDPARGFAYGSPGKYPECAIFETPEGEAEMADFVRRNDSHCERAADSPSCHAQYHFTDEAIQRARYRLGDAGTRPFDVVAAVSAMIRVLQGQPAPAPFDIKDQREALLLLAHYVGDIAQPLHVGVDYLDERGRPVDPARDADRAQDTQGGNRVVTIRAATNHRSETLHATWDDLPESLNARHIDGAWLALARRVPRTEGHLAGWSTQWADDTLAQARIAWGGLDFRPQEAAGQWTTTLAGCYDDAMAPIKKRQLTLAGARLAQVLTTVWP